MTQQPFSAAALRGAVDLSSLAPRGGTAPGAPGVRPGSVAAGAAGAPGGVAGGAGQGPVAVPGRVGALLHATDETFEAAITGSMTTPVVLVLWTPQAPESLTHLRDLAQAAVEQQGRFQVVGVDLGQNPGVMQALTPLLQQVFGQVSALPVVLGLLAGQPMPFYLGAQPMDQVDELLGKFLEAAVANGITGRVDVSAGLGGDGAPEGAAGTTPDEGEGEPELPPLHQRAYEAIDAGDWPGAVAAYEQALAQDPADELARLGLGQVRLLERAGRLDPAAVRAAAADRPQDVDAQLAAADLDMVGGHVEDAFGRLVDAVRRTGGDDRDRARTRLLELFEVVGPQDPRVGKARSALMSALF